MNHLARKVPLFWQSILKTTVSLVLLILLLFTYDSANAKGFSLILNGKSFHKEQPKKIKYNEKNWGLGIQYDYALYNNRWVPYLTTSAFKDSFKRNSFYAGGGMMRRFSLAKLHEGLLFDAGLVGFIMTRKDLNNRKPFLGVLPAFSIGTEKIAINISYIPKVAPKLVPLWFVQLKLSL